MLRFASRPYMKEDYCELNRIPSPDATLQKPPSGLLGIVSQDG